MYVSTWGDAVACARAVAVFRWPWSCSCGSTHGDYGRQISRNRLWVTLAGIKDPEIENPPPGRTSRMNPAGLPTIAQIARELCAYL
jgi:hypothetical protein